MPDIVISEFMDAAAVESLAGDFDTHYDPGLVGRPEDLAGLLGDARGLIVRNRTRVDAALLDSAPALKVVGRLGVGLDNIDLAKCEARNIAVRPASGANDVSVAEYVIATAMLLLRSGFNESQGVIDGDWPRENSIGREVAGKVMGFVGFGGIARETALRATALGMEIVAHDPFITADDPAAKNIRLLDLDALMSGADVVSLHVPFSDSTRGLIDGKAIGRMKKSAVLINTSRGGIVDEDALCKALGDGAIAGAALDVFAKEPVDAKDGGKFRNVPNLILTPHIAGVTEESNVRVSAVTAANVRAVLDGSRVSS